MKTEVIFRKDKQGGIIAFFPYVFHRGAFNVSFCDDGHSACDVSYIREKTKPCNEDEYKYRMRLLSNYYGYDLRVIKRINHKKWCAEYYKQNKTKNQVN